jgi:hypothetical protein
MSYYISILDEVNRLGEISIEQLSKTFGITYTRTEYLVNKGISDGYLEKFVNGSDLSVKQRHTTKYKTI